MERPRLLSLLPFVTCAALACGSGDTGPQGPAGPAGAAGAAGADGKDGTSATSDGGVSISPVYGDGSSGALDVPAGSTVTTLDGTKTEFTDITIEGPLNVPSGIVLRATGSVTISGDVSALLGGAPGSFAASPAPGLALRGAFAGSRGTGAETGGAGVGGGAIVILANGPIVVKGTLSAAGDFGSGGTHGSGGGAGGIIVLASHTSAELDGKIDVHGGDGDDSNATFGARAGGGGGGACGGNGGDGGNVNTAGVSGAAGAGQPGYTFLTQVDPTSLFAIH